MADPKCTIRDNKFVDPCPGLLKASEGDVPHGKKRGIFQWVYTDLATGKQSRSFFGTKSGIYVDKGAVFNFCPFCGEKIDSHLLAKPVKRPKAQREPA